MALVSRSMDAKSGSIGMPDGWMARARLPLLLCALIVAVSVLAFLADPLTQRRVIMCLIWMIAVIGLQVFMGNSGVLNFSTAAFMGVGAYASALTTMPAEVKALFLPDLPVWLAGMQMPTYLGPFLALALGMVIAVVIGWPLMRLTGIAAGIATFSVMLIGNVVLGNWTSVTGGQTSLTGVPTFVSLPVAAGFAMVAVIIAHLFAQSRICLPLQASREDEVAARAAGTPVNRLRLLAFVLGSGLGALSGALMGHFQGTLRVETFYFDTAFLLVAMLVLGGMRSISGAVVGTLAVSFLTEVLRKVEAGIDLPFGAHLAAPAGLGDLIVAGGMLLILIFRPLGITGGRELDAIWRQSGRKTKREDTNA